MEKEISVAIAMNAPDRRGQAYRDDPGGGFSDCELATAFGTGRCTVVDTGLGHTVDLMAAV